MNNSRGRRFLFTTLETSAHFAKGISTLRTIACNPRCLESRETLQQPRSATTSLRVAILIFVDKQAVPATFLDFLQALALQIPSEIVKMQ